MASDVVNVPPYEGRESLEPSWSNDGLCKRLTARQPYTLQQVLGSGYRDMNVAPA